MTAIQPSGLWSDEPTTDDLLSFDAVAGTVVDAVLDDTLDPLAIGISGAWGSGKTTILRLIDADLAQRSLPNDPKILVAQTDGSPDVSVGRDHAAARPGRGGQRPPRVSSAMAMRDSGLRP